MSGGKKRAAKVKICGLYRDEDIEMVNELLPDYVGFVIDVPKSHRNVSVSQVIEWKKVLDPRIQTVGVFVNSSVEDIVSVSSALDVVQLHGSETEETVAILKKALEELAPSMEFWKAFSVKSKEEVERALAFKADHILLDYGKGEGKTFDWSILKECKQSFFLAGGITPENVKEAIKTYAPELIDVSSGVETNQKKDRDKIKKLLKEMEL